MRNPEKVMNHLNVWEIMKEKINIVFKYRLKNRNNNFYFHWGLLYYKWIINLEKAKKKFNSWIQRN